MNTIKIGNTEFNIDSFPYKTKRDFMTAYSSDTFKFDREKAWKELRKYIKK